MTLRRCAFMTVAVLAGGLTGAVWDQRRSCPPAQGDYVIVLHGLGRSCLSMKFVEWELKREGYRVVNMGYRSRGLSVEEIARNNLRYTIESQVKDPSAKVHFVGYSLGAIVVRQYLKENHMANLGRVVMLGPPNQGSEIVDKLCWSRLLRWCMGPAGQKLGTGATSVPRSLGPPTFELGVIAGDRSFNPLFSAWLRGPDDGKVSVESTRLQGMKEHRVVHHSHTWLAWRKPVIALVLSFLRDGTFG